MSEAAGTPPPASEARPDSAVGRLAGVFLSPVRTFEAIARRPTWVLPLALYLAVSTLIAVVMIPKVDWGNVIREQAEKRGKTPSDAEIQTQLERVREYFWLYETIAVIGAILFALLPACLFWLALKAFGWDIRFPQSIAVTTHAWMPAVVSSILFLAVVWRLEVIDQTTAGDLVKSNPGFLVDAKSSPVLHSLLQSLDVFSFWTMALLVIGLSAAAKITRGKAAALVVTFWGLYVLGKAGFAALFS